jgi:RNA polymerase sigma factor (sigma-70 family)
MDADTRMGGTRHAFPPTRHSIVIAARSEDCSVRQQAFDELIAVYWKPVYKYIRIKWHASNEDAKDLTQEFFAAAFEKSFFQPYDPKRSKFRTFVRTCVDGLVMNAAKAAGRIKRGGETQIVPLDFETAELELHRDQASAKRNPDDFFDREWVRSLFELAVNDLRRESGNSEKRRVQFALFERYDLDPPADGALTYQQLAAEYQMPVTQITNFLAAARGEFRRHVLDRLRSITGSDEEFRSEAHRLLGVKPQ